MTMLPSDAINRARGNANRQNSAFPTDDDIIRWVSDAEAKYWKHINFHVKRWNVTEYEFQRDSTQRAYALPFDYGGYFTYLEYYGGSGKPDELMYTKRRDFAFTTGATPERFYVDRNRIQLDPQPDVSDSVNTMRMGYHRQPQRKHIGTAQNNDSVQIQLASSPATGNVRNVDSAYVNEKIRTVAGTGSGQERDIVSFDGSTYKASVATKFDTAVSTDTKYETVVDVPHADEEAIVKGTQMKMAQKDGMPDNVDRKDFQTALDGAVQRIKSTGYGRWEAH